MHSSLRSLFAGAAAALTLALSPVAQAALTTFDGDVADTTPAPFTSGGLVFSGPATFVWHGSPTGANNGTNSLISGFGSSFTITKDGGGTFSLSAFDAGLSWYTGLGSLAISVGGENIVLGTTYQTYNFSSLTNVTSVTVSVAPADGYFSVDNVVWQDASTVPEPTGLLLAGAALAALSMVRRRKKA